MKKLLNTLCMFILGLVLGVISRLLDIYTSIYIIKYNFI